MSLDTLLWRWSKWRNVFHFLFPMERFMVISDKVHNAQLLNHHLGWSTIIKYPPRSLQCWRNSTECSIRWCFSKKSLFYPIPKENTHKCNLKALNQYLSLLKHNWTRERLPTTSTFISNISMFMPGYLHQRLLLVKNVSFLDLLVQDLLEDNQQEWSVWWNGLSILNSCIDRNSDWSFLLSVRFFRWNGNLVFSICISCSFKFSWNISFRIQDWFPATTVWASFISKHITRSIWRSVWWFCLWNCVRTISW